METWRLKAVSVAKYNPQLYNEEGDFIGDDWTSFSDIGKEIDSVTNTILTQERYLEVESKYLQALLLFMRQTNSSKIRVFDVYKHSDCADFDKHNDRSLYNIYQAVKENNVYQEEEVSSLLQLALREYLQISFELLPNSGNYVYFGYDYYMYFVSEDIDIFQLQATLVKTGLYLR